MIRNPMSLATTYHHGDDAFICPAFVGLATIVVLLPVPGYIAKQVQRVQKTRLTKSDARVQSITEGKQTPNRFVIHNSSRSDSYECHQNGQAIRLGKENERKGC